MKQVLDSDMPKWNPITLEDLVEQMGFYDDDDKDHFVNYYHNIPHLIYRTDNGGLWPVLIISICKNMYNDTSIGIFSDIKKAKDDWWIEYGIPMNLLGDVADLLKNCDVVKILTSRHQ